MAMADESRREAAVHKTLADGWCRDLQAAQVSGLSVFLIGLIGTCKTMSAVYTSVLVLLERVHYLH